MVGLIRFNIWNFKIPFRVSQWLTCRNDPCTGRSPYEGAKIVSFCRKNCHFGRFLSIAEDWQLLTGILTSRKYIIINSPKFILDGIRLALQGSSR